MPRLAGFLMLLLVSSCPLLGQPVPAVVPPPDYKVYAAVVNRFNELHRKGKLPATPLLLINEYTVVFRRHGFNVDFSDLESRSPVPFSQTDRPLNTPEWTAFVMSVDTSQFTRRRLKRLPRVTGYKTIGWTPALNAYYFAKESTRRGFFDVQRDYKDFSALVSFSKVAYSSDKRKAFCYYAEVSDELAGDGLLVFLEKKAGRWQVVDALMLWVS